MYEDINMKKGFTLAEVLITLTIIGVVAAMTIPTLVQNSQKQEYVSKLQKFVSVFSNGMKMAMVNTNCSDLLCADLEFGSLRSATASDPLPQAFLDATGFKIIKECRRASNMYLDQSTDCWAPTKALDGTNQSIRESSSSAAYEFVLTDGMAVDISYGFDSCSLTDVNDVKSCALITVDVNGLKAPNQTGRDVFSFWLGRNGALYPSYGAKTLLCSSAAMCWDKGTTVSCLPTATGAQSGQACAARIMEHGWQMDY